MTKNESDTNSAIAMKTGRIWDRVIQILRENRSVVVLILLTTSLVYMNSLAGKFLYDDWFQIERNPMIRSWSNVPALLVQHVWEFIKPVDVTVTGVYYRPFFNIALLVNYQLFGLDVTGWHVVSLIFHLAATALVFYLALEWKFSKRAAIFAAFLFGVHPVHVEAVAWASALPDLMVGTFVLASVLFYEKSRTGEKQIQFSVVSILFAFLATGSKEPAIMLPIFFLLREIFGKQSEDRLDIAKRLAPYFAVAFVGLVARYLVIGVIFPPNPTTKDISFSNALLSVPPALVEYLRLFFYPVHLAVIYDFNFVSYLGELRIWTAIAFLILIALIAIALVKSERRTAFAFALLVFLIPALNLRSLAPFESLIHDRYLYLASAGICIVMAFTLDLASLRSRKFSQAIYITAAALILLIASLLTVYQNTHWKDDFALTRNALRYSPNSALMNLHLGELYADVGNTEQAEIQFRRGIELSPELGIGYYTLANFLSSNGRNEEADPLFQRAMALGMETSAAWVDRGVNFMRQGKVEDANRAFERALQISPDDASAHYNLGTVYERLSQIDKAEDKYRAAIKINKEFVEARVALAMILVGRDQIDAARAEIEKIRENDPASIDALLPVGAIYLKQRQCGPAVDVLARYQNARPANSKTFTLLGLGYECSGNSSAAKEAYLSAVRSATDDAMVQVAQKRLEQLK